MENESCITDEDVMRNQFMHPDNLKDPEDIKSFYETYTARFEGTCAEDQFRLWNNYYIWASKFYGKDSEICIDILTRTTKRLKNESSLYESMRFVVTWITYASHVNRPLDVYKFMEENKIGAKTYVYYIKYAITVERNTRDFKRVDKIFREGISKCSKNVLKIENSYNDFAKRMRERINDIVNL